MNFNPKVQVVNYGKGVVKFRLDDANSALANSLRRVIVSEILTLSIDSVKFYSNESVLHDEFISHRLSLLVLDSRVVNAIKCDCNTKNKINTNAISENKSLESNTISESKVIPESNSILEYKGCPLCTFSFHLNVRCTGHQSLIVTADMLVASNPDVQCINPKAIITKLDIGQSLQLEAIAKVGTGKEHAKWSAVCGVGYHVNNSTSYQLTVESSGSIPGPQIVTNGLKVLNSNLDTILEIIKK